MPEINEDDREIFSNMICFTFDETLELMREFEIPDIPGTDNILNQIQNRRPIGKTVERFMENLEKSLRKYAAKVMPDHRDFFSKSLIDMVNSIWDAMSSITTNSPIIYHSKHLKTIDVKKLHNLVND